LLPVVKVQERSFDSAFPARSSAPVATMALYLLFAERPLDLPSSGRNDLIGWIEEQGEEDTQGFAARVRF
jgi:hypothetical protein